MTQHLVAEAVAWALERLGDPTYSLRCLAFVEDAYERPNRIEVFGGASASESAALYGVQPYRSGDPPPAGALVFYSCTGPIGGVVDDWGHVGIALGDGRIVHAWDEVRIDGAEALERLPPATGWSSPRLIGWTAADRLLKGHRPRDWDNA